MSKRNPQKEVLLEGYFLKKKRDDKRSLMSSKYQKRYFRLTAETLAYAKAPEEISTGNSDNVQYFPIAQLQYVKRMDKFKLEIRFPTRVLVLKAESTNEAEGWEAALQRANMMTLHSEQDKASTQKTPQIPVQLQIATIEGDSDSSDDNAPAVRRSGAPKQRVSPGDPPTREALPSRTNLGIQVPVGGGRVEADKPPSPRSMLANPKFGNKMVSSAPRPPPVDGYYNGGRQQYEREAKQYDDGYGGRQQEVEHYNDGYGHGGRQQQQQRGPPPEEERITLEPAARAHSGRSGPGDDFGRESRGPPPEEERLVLGPAGGRMSSGYRSSGGGSGAGSSSRAHAHMPPHADMEVLTLGHGGIAGIASPSGRPPRDPRSNASPRRATTLQDGGLGSARGPSPTGSLNTSLRSNLPPSLNTSLRSNAQPPSLNTSLRSNVQPPSLNTSLRSNAAPSLNTSLRSNAAPSPRVGSGSGNARGSGGAASSADENFLDEDFDSEEEDTPPPPQQQQRQQQGQQQYGREGGLASPGARQVHGRGGAPATLPMAPACQTQEEDWDSGGEDGRYGGGLHAGPSEPAREATPRGAARAAAPHVGARWAKRDAGRWEADAAGFNSPRGVVSPGTQAWDGGAGGGAKSRGGGGREYAERDEPEAPSAGVAVDANFADDDWDSDQ
ncbi:hypothetical protein FOA52_010552 [Chlamydomonas sp. UWO 241]|nr:hypothetical protein FOA52_010552 [Chlamydomonas sp. UWO 241]